MVGVSVFYDICYLNLFANNTSTNGQMACACLCVQGGGGGVITMREVLYRRLGAKGSYLPL